MVRAGCEYFLDGLFRISVRITALVVYEKRVLKGFEGFRLGMVLVEGFKCVCGFV